MKLVSLQVSIYSKCLSLLFMLYCFKSFSSQVKFKIFQASPILGKPAVTPFPIPVHLPTNQQLTDASVIHAPTYRWGFGGLPGSTFVVGESATLFPANRNTYADKHVWSIINYALWTGFYCCSKLLCEISFLLDIH